MSFETKEKIIKPIKDVNHHMMLQNMLVIPNELCLKSRLAFISSLFNQANATEIADEVSLCMFLNCGRKLDYPQEIKANMRRT